MTVTLFTEELAIELHRPPLPGLRQIIADGVLVEYNHQRNGWEVKQLDSENHEWLDILFVQIVQIEKKGTEMSIKAILAQAKALSEARHWARRMMRERDEARAEAADLRKVLEEVEWHCGFCPWCVALEIWEKHKPNCPRQVALGLEKEE